MSAILKRVLTGITVGSAVVAAVVLAPCAWVAPAVGVLAVLAVAEFALLLRIRLPIASPKFACSFLLGAAVIALGLSALPAIACRFGNLTLLYVIAIVKFSDTGGFAFGLSSARLLRGGNHKLCPTISPAKSWEGLFGSVVFSCVVSCGAVAAARAFSSPPALAAFGWTKAILFGVAAALLGTFGDLVESKFKRWVGVKDSSALKLTNGLGGFLDMFDSLLFAPAVLLPFI